MRQDLHDLIKVELHYPSSHLCNRILALLSLIHIFPHRSRTADIALARQLGLEEYLSRIEEKHTILNTLLAGYNDGRRKTLFNTAVYLLPLADLRAVMTALNDRPELSEQPVKERALAAAALLQQAAGRQGISLRLNKKSKKG